MSEPESVRIDRPKTQSERFSAPRAANEKELDSFSELEVLEGFLENCPVGLHWVGPDGLIIHANRFELDLLGYSHDEYVGHHIAEFHVDQDVIGDMLARLTRGETLTSVEARLRCKNGSIKHVIINSNVFREGGEFVHTRCCTLDVTQQRQVEEALQESEQRFRKIFEQAAVGVALIETNSGRFVRINNKYAELIGYTKEETLQKTFMDVSFPDDLEEDLDSMQALHAGTIREFSMEKRLIRNDGSVVWCNLTVSPTWDPGEEPRFHIAIVEDITDRNRARRLLQESEARLRSLFDNVPAYILVVDRDGRILFINQTVEGLSMEDVIGASAYDFLNPEAIKIAEEAIRAVFETGEPQQYEIQGPGNDGTEAWYSCRLGPIYQNDEVISAIYVSTDITEQKAAAAAQLARGRQQAAVAELGFVALKETHLQEVMNQAAHLVADTLDAPMCQILEWTDNRQSLFLKAGVGWEAGSVGNTRISAVASHIDDTFSDGADVIGDLQKEPHFIESDLLLRHQAVSGVNVVIQAQHESYGFLGAYAKSKRGFDVDEIHFLKSIANVLGDAIQRSRVQERLAASEVRFRALIENSYDVINMFSADGESLYASPSVKRVLGYEPEELIGKRGPIIVHPDDLDEAVRGFTECLGQPGSVAQFKHRLRHKDGTYRTVDVTGTNLLDTPGVNAMVSIFRDVTEHDRAQAELADRERALRLMQYSIDTSHIPTFWVDRDSRFHYVNEAAATSMGYTRDELSGMSVADIAPNWTSDDWPRTWAQLKQTRSKKIESVHQRKDGTPFPVEIMLNYFSYGQDEFILCVALDITERKLAQQQLMQTRFSVESVSEAMFNINPDGRFVDVNKMACERLGYSRDELLSMTVADINPNFPIQSWPQHWEELKREGRLLFESEHQTKDGRTIPVEVAKSYFQFEGNEYACAFVRDVTERKQAEEDRQRMVALVEHSRDFIGLAEMDGSVRYVNRAGRKLVGLESLEDAKQTATVDYLPPEDVPWLDEVMPVLHKEGSWAGEHRFQHFVTGQNIPLHINSFVIRDPSNEQPIGIGMIARDISERKRQEERLREHEQALAHVSRLSTMGEMVAGISHEINQPLSAISNFSAACSKGIADSNHQFAFPIEDWLEKIGSQAVRCGDIIRRLRRFVKKNENERGCVSLFEVLEDSIALVDSDARHGSISVARPKPGQVRPVVSADRVELQQVVVNLLRNAFDAVGGNDAADRHVRVSIHVERELIRLTVDDNGPGIRSEYLGKLFDAFFTTKKNGLGMGLAISKTIVEAHGGNLRVESNDSGARFHVELPSLKEELYGV